MGTRYLTATIAVGLAFIVFTVLPQPALAGGYDVYACEPSVGGNVNHAWSPVADAGMTAYTDCGGGQGLVARNVYDGAASGFLQGAYMILDAPEGNSIDSITMDFGMRRPDCNWSVLLVGGNRDLAGGVITGLPAGQYCDSQFQTPNETTFFGAPFTFSVGMPRVRIEARCGAASCTRNGVAAFHMRSVDVRVRDDVAPALPNGRGPSGPAASGWRAPRRLVSTPATARASMTRRFSSTGVRSPAARPAVTSPT